MYPHFRNGSYQWYQSRRSSAARCGASEEMVEAYEIRHPYSGEMEEMDEEYEIQQLQHDMTKLRRGMEELRLMFVSTFSLSSDPCGLHLDSSELHHFDNSQSADKKKHMKEAYAETSAVESINACDSAKIEEDMKSLSQELTSEGSFSKEKSSIEVLENGAIHVFAEMPNRNSETYSSSEMDEKQVKSEANDEKIKYEESAREKNEFQESIRALVSNRECFALVQPTITFSWQSVEEAECQRAYELGTEIYMSTFELVKEPVGVVSVCDRARRGKSFIFNQHFRSSSGFQVASMHRPSTKGLWLWRIPLCRTALDGTEYNLLLLNSEEIDAYDQTGIYSTEIFSLVVLLSSMFIYNQMGGIGEATLDRLSLMTVMSDEKMKAITAVGMKWHLGVENQRYLPLPPPDPPPWSPLK